MSVRYYARSNLNANKKDKKQKAQQREESGFIRKGKFYYNVNADFDNLKKYNQ